jgi:hypothetical protein
MAGDIAPLGTSEAPRNMELCLRITMQILIVGLCIPLRMYPLNIGITSVCNTVFFLVLDFIVRFSHYMFGARLAAIFKGLPWIYFCVYEPPEDGRQTGAETCSVRSAQ